MLGVLVSIFLVLGPAVGSTSTRPFKPVTAITGEDLPGGDTQDDLLDPLAADRPWIARLDDHAGAAAQAEGREAGGRIGRFDVYSQTAARLPLGMNSTLLGVDFRPLGAEAARSGVSANADPRPSERNVRAVPESTSFFLLGTGLVGLALSRKRFKK